MDILSRMPNKEMLLSLNFPHISFVLVDGDTLLTEIPTVPQGPVNITENEYPYRKTINYRNGVTYEQLESLISRSQECKQMISFTCKDSRLMTKMGK